MGGIKLLKTILKGVKIPPGYKLVGWIEKHPADKEKNKSAYAVLRSHAGAEVAWDGGAVRSLPAKWREKVEWEDADELAYLTSRQPKGLISTIDSALREGETQTNFVREACVNELAARGIEIELPEIRPGRPSADTSSPVS